MDYSLLSNRERYLLNKAGRYFEYRLARRIPANSHERFLARLSKFQFELANVVQDHHATFRVLSRSIFGSEHDYRMMRACVAIKIRADSGRYQSLLRGWNLNTYCTLVENDLIADELCTLAACELFQVTFRTLHDEAGVVFTEVAPSKRRQLRPISRKVIWCSTSQTFGIRPIQKATAEDFVAIQEDVDMLRQNLGDPARVIEICEQLLRHLPENHVYKCQYARLSKRISEWGFAKINVTGDGACILRTLSFIIYNTQENHLLVREMVVAKLKTNQARYDRLRHLEKHPTEGRIETYQEFLSRIARPNEWGDGACLQAAADSFKIMITVLDSERDILLREYVPSGFIYFSEVFSCESSHHSDAMILVQRFRDWVELQRANTRREAIAREALNERRDYSSGLTRLFGPE